MWIPPGPGERYFRFLIAPATQVLHKGHDLRLSLGPPDTGSVTVLTMTRAETEARGVYAFVFTTLGGSVSLRASGFSQWLRAEPRLHTGPCLDLAEQGGMSFATG